MRKRRFASARSSVNSCVAAAESVRTMISASVTTSPGNCSSASATSAMWSAAVLAPALPGPQQAGQRLAGVVQIGQQRVKPEPALKRSRRTLLLAVRGDQRRVDVDHDPLGRGARAPGVLACPRPGDPQRPQQALVAGQRVDHAKRGRVGGDRPEQRLLIAHGAQVGQTVAAVGQHHGQVPNDLAGVMPAAPLTRARQRARELAGQPDPVGRLGQQRRAGVRNHTRSVRHDIYVEPAPIALHPQGDPPEPRRLGLRQPQNPCSGGQFSGPAHPGPQLLSNERSGLVAHRAQNQTTPCCHDRHAGGWREPRRGARFRCLLLIGAVRTRSKGCATTSGLPSRACLGAVSTTRCAARRCGRALRRSR